MAGIRGCEPTWGWCPPLPRSKERARKEQGRSKGGLWSVGPLLLNLPGSEAQGPGGWMCKGP